jgi:hypothetical protein
MTDDWYPIAQIVGFVLGVAAVAVITLRQAIVRRRGRS